MKHILLLLPLALIAAGPAVAGPGQPRQEAAQPSRGTNYWLSRDMQRLVFWQSRDRGPQAAPRS